MKKYQEKLVKEIISEELSGQHPYYNSSREDHNEVVIDTDATFADGYSIDIDKALEYLRELKRRGAEHVHIFYHSDHQEYHFYGVKFIEQKEKPKEKTDRSILFRTGNKFKFPKDDRECTFISLEVIDGKFAVLYDDKFGQRKKVLLDSLSELKKV
jgi:hypothetical protein